MRGIKILFGTTALLAGLALAPAAQAQVVIDIGVQPSCAYGYYDYAPYACAPYGYYGPGYFYNGIFLGMGPWAGWGYSHGWGSHRFSERGRRKLSWRRRLACQSQQFCTRRPSSRQRGSFPFRRGASQRRSADGSARQQLPMPRHRTHQLRIAAAAAADLAAAVDMKAAAMASGTNP